MRKSTIIFLLFSISLILTHSSARGWFLESDEPVLMCRIIDSTRCVYSTENNFWAIDVRTGDIAWTLPDWNCNAPEQIGIVPGTSIILVYDIIRISERNSMTRERKIQRLNTIAAIDLKYGDMLWKSDTADFASCAGYYLLPGGKSLLMCVRNMEDTYWMRAVDLTSGAVIWENREFFEGEKPETFSARGADKNILGNQSPVFDSDSTMITMYRADGLAKWNIKTGEQLWRSELNAGCIPFRSDGYLTPLLSEDGSELWVPCDKGLQAVATIDGSLKWDTTKVFPGIVHRIVPEESGLYIIGGPKSGGGGGDQFITLLNRATGSREWEFDFLECKGGKTSPTIISDDSLYVWSNKKIYAVSKRDGSFTIIDKEIKLENGETPNYFGLRGGNYLLISSQNMIMLDHSLRQVYSLYFKPPNPKKNFWQKLDNALFYAGAIASIASMDLDRFATQYAYAFVPGVDYGLPKYGLSVVTKDYMFVVGESDKKTAHLDEGGWGLFKINKSNGAIVSRVGLGELVPLFEVSPDGDGVLFIGAKNEIIYRKM
ncbi:MAG: PQQ-binding-like beta-propeller repeat protein [Candidatus Zixiibacteriota bacterium]